MAELGWNVEAAALFKDIEDEIAALGIIEDRAPMLGIKDEDAAVLKYTEDVTAALG